MKSKPQKRRVKGPLYITPKINDATVIVKLQNVVLETTNAGLISIELHFLCCRFVKELRQIALSEELQTYSLKDSHE